MGPKDWGDFKARYPELSKSFCELGNQLYQMGVEKAQKSPELETLHALVVEAPEDALAILGLSKDVTRTGLLTTVVNIGSKLLLEYVRE